MKISKEVRIGLLVTAALAIFFIGFSFLKGSDVFSNDKDYYCYLPDAEGLQKSAFVQIKGLTVGQVTELELAGEQGVKVTLSIHRKTKLPKGTIANLASTGLMGGMFVRLDLGTGPDFEVPGAVLPALKDGGALDKISGELTPRLEELKGTITAFNAALANINSLVGKDNQIAINSTIQSLKLISDNLANLSSALSKQSSEITGIIHNTNSITGSLAKSNDTIQRILSNFNRISGQLANAPLQKTITDLQKTAAQMESIMGKINNNQGSMGMLVNDKELYINMNKSLKSINDLTTDLKAHPARYIKISVFGGGKKKD